MQRNKIKGAKFLLLILVCLSLLFNAFPAYADTAPPPVLLNSYTGDNGVIINSYSKAYQSTDSLKAVYDELMKNTTGEEISTLSAVNLYGAYPLSSVGNITVATSGQWTGNWQGGKLVKGSYINIYGCDVTSFEDMALTLSSQYGNHFVLYWLNKKENTVMDISNSSFAKVRKLDLSNEILAQNLIQIAAGDYVQLLGSPTVAKNPTYTAVPQNRLLPVYAWAVPGLYNYFTTLGGVTSNKNHIPPSKPVILLTKNDAQSIDFTWSSTDDEGILAYDVYYEWSGAIASRLDSKINLTTSSLSIPKSLMARENPTKLKLNVIAVDKSGNAINQEITVDLQNAKVIALPKRLAGQSRYETSIEVSKAGWANGSQYAVLVTGENFPDALCAAPLAKKYNAPILLTNPNTLDSTTESEINRLGIKNIFIVGGTGVVSDTIKAALEAKGISVTRISGNSRYETSLEVAKRLGTFDKIFVATGENFPDALSVASTAASQNAPILLVSNSEGLPQIQNFLKDKNINKTYIAGGTGVISDSIMAQLPNTERLAGQSRYETNLAVLAKFGSSQSSAKMYLATGENYPDALSGSALAALQNAPVVLVDSTDVSGVKNYLSSKSANGDALNVVGGEGAVSSATLQQILN